MSFDHLQNQQTYLEHVAEVSVLANKVAKAERFWRVTRPSPPLPALTLPHGMIVSNLKGMSIASKMPYTSTVDPQFVFMFMTYS